MPGPASVRRLSRPRRTRREPRPRYIRTCAAQFAAASLDRMDFEAIDERDKAAAAFDHVGVKSARNQCVSDRVRPTGRD